jgi:hypothetical protein
VRLGDSIRVALCLLLAACARRLPHATYTPQPSSALVAVTRAPPPARVESVPASPARSAVWVDGEWTWRRARWAWMPGRWLVPPAGATFSPWVFVRAPDGTFWYAPGVWRDAKDQVIQEPTALAVAVVEGSEVVNANGMTETTGPTLRPGKTRASPPPPEAPSSPAP